ncbi:hypothetical protein PPSIR1_33516 [Plesiocystis pacifica SIR-1]|uniref:Uncharacterized protein n=1 Tax=Plesiocystis pacifica SIR-1 TaxID=391625 RepID=A6GE47_9BACT|nr:hypothetical protein [Plesiocystis pacifica]EDM75838.1 hypothetical protein PPSIR1_33516 [Plesiocystis pacifica SIR-1]
MRLNSFSPARLLALVFFLGVVLTGGRARAAEPPGEAGSGGDSLPSMSEGAFSDAGRCARSMALDNLEPDARLLLQGLLCPGGGLPRPSAAELDGALRTLVTSSDWTSKLALDATRALGSLAQDDASIRARRVLETVVSEPACSDVQRFLDDQVERALEGQLVLPPRDAIVNANRRCLAALDPADLEALDDVALLGYYGNPDDAYEAVVAEPSPAYVPPVIYESQGPDGDADDGPRGLAQLLPIPVGSAAVLFVYESGQSLPWRRDVAPGTGRDFAQIPKGDPQCLKVEFATPVDDLAWEVVVDGVSFPVDAQPEGGGAYAIGRLDLVDVPAGSHEVHFIHHGRDWGSEVVETTGTRKRCALVEADVRGLGAGYGLTRLVMDERCTERGLVPAQVRKLVERYFDDHGYELRQLDVIVEILASFSDIESNLSVDPAAENIGSNKLDASTDKQLSTFAAELMRQGVAKLLTLSVSCAEDGEDMVVVGQTIDLQRFSERQRSRAAGVDLSEILEVRTGIVEDRRSRRQGFEEVLGGLLGRPTVHIVPPPKRVDFHNDLDVQYHMQRGKQGEVQFEFGVARVERPNVCAHAEDLATLAAFDNSALRRDIDGLVQSGMVKQQLWLLDADDANLTLTTDVPFGGPGEYLVWLREVGGDAVAATCFSVDSRDAMIYGQFGGLTASRPGPLRAQQMFYFRVDLGFLYALGQRKLGRFGGQLGYTNVSYDSAAPLSWDDLSEATLGGFATNGQYHMHWTRHSFSFAGVAGFDVPLGVCGYEFPKPDKLGPTRFERRGRRCAQPFFRRFNLHGRLIVGGSFGFHDISQIPSGFGSLSTRESGSRVVSDIDFDVGLQLGLEARLTAKTAVYTFYKLLVTDVDSCCSSTSDIEASSTVGNDFGALSLVGVGVAWMRSLQ